MELHEVDPAAVPVHREITVGYTGDGKRTRRKVSGTTKAAVIDKLRDLRTQLDTGVTPRTGYAHYTVRQAAEDWLAHGLDGRSPKTVTKNRNVLAPILTVIGARKLRDLSAADVRQALAAMAAGYSAAAVSMGHLALKRAIRHAEASDLVTRNVAALADTPKGQDGRPSESLTPDQAVAVMTAARTLPVMELRPGLKDVRRPAELMHACITLSLLCGPIATSPSLPIRRGVSVGELAPHLWHRAAGFCRPGALEGSPGGWVRSTDPPGRGPGVRQAQRQALPRSCKDGLTDAGYHRSARLKRRLRAACDDSQYLAADRAAARPDDMPVRGEGPPGLRVRRENAGLGAQQGSCRDRFEAKFHPGLDPSRFGPGAQGRRVQMRRYRSAQQAPGLAEAC